MTGEVVVARTVLADIAAGRYDARHPIPAVAVEHALGVSPRVARAGLELLVASGGLTKGLPGSFLAVAPLPPRVLALLEPSHATRVAAATYHALLEHVRTVPPGRPIGTTATVASQLGEGRRDVATAFAEAAGAGLVARSRWASDWVKDGWDFSHPRARSELVRFAARRGWVEATLLARLSLRADAERGHADVRAHAGSLAELPPSPLAELLWPTLYWYPRHAPAGLVLQRSIAGGWTVVAGGDLRRGVEQTWQWVKARVDGGAMAWVDRRAMPFTRRATATPAAAAADPACVAAMRATFTDWGERGLAVAEGVSERAGMTFLHLPDLELLVATGPVGDAATAAATGLSDLAARLSSDGEP